MINLLPGMKPAFLEKDPEKQKEMYQKFMLETVVPHVGIVNTQLEKNSTGFLVGSEVSPVIHKLMMVSARLARYTHKFHAGYMG